MNASRPVLRVEDLHGYYDKSHVIRGVSFEIAPGGGMALLGRNGAGKTTTMRAVMGLLSAAPGIVEVDGERVDHRPVHARAKRGLALVFEDRRVIPGLTVEQNIELPAWRSSGELISNDDIYEIFPKLGDIRARDAGHLSGGEQQMLAIGRAIKVRPRVLLLDEPSEGLAPRIVEDLVESIQRLRRDLDVAILVAEHKQWFSREVAEGVGVVSSQAGRLVFNGTWSQFDAHPEIANTHLSLGSA